MAIFTINLPEPLPTIALWTSIAVVVLAVMLVGYVIIRDSTKKEEQTPTVPQEKQEPQLPTLPSPPIVPNASPIPPPPPPPLLERDDRRVSAELNTLLEDVDNGLDGNRYRNNGAKGNGEHRQEGNGRGNNLPAPEAPRQPTKIASNANTNRKTPTASNSNQVPVVTNTEPNTNKIVNSGNQKTNSNTNKNANNKGPNSSEQLLTKEDLENKNNKGQNSMEKEKVNTNSSQPLETPGDSNADLQWQKDMLRVHNEHRARYNVAPLQWSPRLAAIASDWISEKGVKPGNASMLPHSPRRPGGFEKQLGENIAWGWDSRAEAAEAQASADTVITRGWVGDEEPHYDRSTHTCKPGAVCGHFTQVVWKDTKEVGCAKAVVPDRAQGGTAVHTVCNYAPAGNVWGKKPF